MKQFNITAQVFKLNDPSKQHLLFNQTYDGNTPEEAIDNFKTFFPNTQYQLIKIHSAEEVENV